MLTNAYLSFFVIIIAIISQFVYYKFARRADKAYEADLVVAVLSARSHHLERNAIRETWLGHLSSDGDLNKSVMVKFVIGNKACDIPPEYRIDPYSCEKWQLRGQVTDDPVLAVQDGDEDIPASTWVEPCEQIEFKVNFPIVVHQLGVAGDVSFPVVVKLLDSASGFEVVRAVYQNSNDGSLHSGFRYKKVEPYVLPKGFEATVSLGSKNKWQPGYSKDLKTKIHHTNGGIISFVQDFHPVRGHYDNARPPGALWYPMVSFNFSIHEPDILKSLVNREVDQMAEWYKTIEVEKTQLQEEINTYGDILLVDVIDTYRNIPNKLLQFHHWVVTSVNFKFLLKTDDDCFVNVGRIYKDLQTFTDRSKIWLGRFRNNWAVEHYGKWAERDYPALTYPRFACGSGNVISKDVVQWISNNLSHLKLYQREDVSMGIWLAAVGAHQYDNHLWQCEKVCLSDMYVMPELRTDELRDMWRHLVQCDDPCGCD